MNKNPWEAFLRTLGGKSWQLRTDKVMFPRPESCHSTVVGWFNLSPWIFSATPLHPAWNFPLLSLHPERQVDKRATAWREKQAPNACFTDFLSNYWICLIPMLRTCSEKKHQPFLSCSIGHLVSPCLVGRHPRTIRLTNQWVINNP